MKVLKILKNVIAAVPVRELKLKLVCGHIVNLTQMSVTMSLPTHEKCRKCYRGLY